MAKRYLRLAALVAAITVAGFGTATLAHSDDTTPPPSSSSSTTTTTDAISTESAPGPVTDSVSVAAIVAPSADNSTIGADPQSVPADGTSSSTITVTLLDAGGAPVEGKTVALSQSGTSSTITAVSATTGATGEATFTVKSDTAGESTYTATDSTDELPLAHTATVTFLAVGQVSADDSTVFADPNPVPADGVTTSTITVTLVDGSGAPVPGKTVTLSQGAGTSTITPVSPTTGEDGTATFTVKSSTPGQVTYTATDTSDQPNVVLTSTETVGFVLPEERPSAADLAAAIARDPGQVTGASFDVIPPENVPALVSTTALTGFPVSGSSYAILTSGDARLAGMPNDSGSSGAGDGGSARGASDVTVLKVDVAVPAGANCLSLNFRFLSEEFPEFVGSSYNDGFIAELDSSTWTTSGGSITAPNNFAFDPSGAVISINSSGATSMSAGSAAGTTYDGATAELVASTPVTPGAHSLYLSIFDQGDSAYDSAAFVDDLRFTTVAPGTCTQGATTVLKTTKTADSAAAVAGGDDGYTVTVQNDGSQSATLTSITDTLPAGFTYVAGSTTGATSADPGVQGQTLTWQVGALSVAAGGSVSIHFGVKVSTELGTYSNNAGATASGVAVTPSGPTAPVTVSTSTGGGGTGGGGGDTGGGTGGGGGGGGGSSRGGGSSSGDSSSSAAGGGTVTALGLGADVSVSISAPVFVHVGDFVTATATITDNGPGQATGVTFASPIPDGLTFLSASTTVGSCGVQSSTIKCDIGTLYAAGGLAVRRVAAAAPSSAIVTMTFSADRTGPLTTSGSVSSNSDPNAGNNSSSMGVTVGPPGSEPPIPTPVQGQSVGAGVAAGAVTADGAPILQGQVYPFGTVFDTTNGILILKTFGRNGQLQTIILFGGVFKLVLAPDGYTEFDLQGGDFAGLCSTPKRALSGDGAKPPKAKPKPTAKKKKVVTNTTVVRSLWGEGKGDFRTKGRYASATVRGTIWLTADRCDGTLVDVREGLLDVLDLARNKHFAVAAAHSYLVRP